MSAVNGGFTRKQPGVLKRTKQGILVRGVFTGFLTLRTETIEYVMIMILVHLKTLELYAVFMWEGFTLDAQK